MHSRAATLPLPSSRISHPDLPEAACARIEVSRCRVLQKLQLQPPTSVFEPELRNSRRVLVGLMTMRVKGTTRPRMTPATRYRDAAPAMENAYA